MTTDAGAAPAVGSDRCCFAAFRCHACSEGLLGRAEPLGAEGSSHAPLPPLGPLAPQLMTFSQLPVADMQDLHLPQGTAVIGTAVLSTPSSPSALGTSIPVLLEQPLYPETPDAASAKPETQTVPRDIDKWGVENWGDQSLCPRCDKPACFLPPGDCPAWHRSAGFLIVVQRRSMPKTGNGRGVAC